MKTLQDLFFNKEGATNKELTAHVRDACNEDAMGAPEEKSLTASKP